MALCEVLVDVNTKGRVAPSWPVEQEEESVEREVEERCSLQELALPTPGIQPGPTPNNSLCDNAASSSPHDMSGNTEVPDSVSEDIAMEKEIEERKEKFLKNLPSTQDVQVLD